MKRGIIYILSIFVLLLSSCDRQINLTQSNNNIPPAVPTGLKVVYASDGEVGIVWNANSDADLLGYNVYRSTDSTNFTILGSTGNDFYLDDSLKYNQKYYYRITATNIWNQESLPSAEVSAEPLNYYPPAVPQGLNANARNWEGKISVYLSWRANFETDIKGYLVYRSTKENFSPDSSNLVGFSAGTDFSDTANLSLYTNYYYKIIAEDNGGLTSIPSAETNDLIYGIPDVIFPEDGASVAYFSSFSIKTIAVPAEYKIIVQENQFFGELWSKSFSTQVVNDTVNVTFDPLYINANTPYYWRIATYSNGNSDPNSVSPLYKFEIKQ